MARNRFFNIDGLEEWQKALIKANGPEFEKTQDRIMRTSGLRLQEYLHDLTPARDGRLSGSMQSGHKDNVYELKVSEEESYVFTGTNVEYASYINDGFEQQKGRFVPGEWKGDTFHYIPGHNSGMVLTGKVIPGVHMFEKAMDYMEDDFQTIIDFEFRRLFADLM